MAKSDDVHEDVPSIEDIDNQSKVNDGTSRTKANPSSISKTGQQVQVPVTIELDETVPTSSEPGTPIASLSKVQRGIGNSRKILTQAITWEYDDGRPKGRLENRITDTKTGSFRYLLINGQKFINKDHLEGFNRIEVTILDEDGRPELNPQGKQRIKPVIESKRCVTMTYEQHNARNTRIDAIREDGSLEEINYPGSIDVEHIFYFAWENYHFWNEAAITAQGYKPRPRNHGNVGGRSEVQEALVGLQ